MLSLIFGLFGLIVGSFLNVLVLRGGVRSLSGRSACMSCGREILWYDLIPVFSWVWLGGKCRFCKSKISAQYPLIELATALLFAVLGAAPIHIILRLLALPISALLIAIAVYDFRHTIIPDAWVWTFNLLALLFSLLFATNYFLLTTNYLLFTILAGPAVALPLFTLWLVSKGRWMGLGDAKLALGMGWLLGPFYGIGALFLAFIVGAVISVSLVFFSSALWTHIVSGLTRTLTLPLRLFTILYIYILSFFYKDGTDILIPNLRSMTKAKLVCGLTMKSEIPFGPFLVATCLFVWISQMYSIPLLFIWQ